VCVHACVRVSARVYVYKYITHSVGAGDPSQSKIDCRSLAPAYAVFIYSFGVCRRVSLSPNPLPAHPSPPPPPPFPLSSQLLPLVSLAVKFVFENGELDKVLVLKLRGRGPGVSFALFERGVVVCASQQYRRCCDGLLVLA